MGAGAQRAGAGWRWTVQQNRQAYQLDNSRGGGNGCLCVFGGGGGGGEAA